MIEITKIVCDFLNVSYVDVFTTSRKKNITEARQIAIYFIRKNTEFTTSKIGTFFNRGHCTVLHSCKVVNDLLDSYPSFKRNIEKIALEIPFINRDKIVYIAHPISGDIKGNVDKILKIVQKINLTEKGIIPFAPYLVDVIALDDNDPEQRKRGISNNLAYFQSGIVKQVRVYGDFISKGVAEEIALARQLDIPVEYFNPNLI